MKLWRRINGLWIKVSANLSYYELRNEAQRYFVLLIVWIIVTTSRLEI